VCLCICVRGRECVPGDTIRVCTYVVVVVVVVVCVCGGGGGWGAWEGAQGEGCLGCTLPRPRGERGQHPQGTDLAVLAPHLHSHNSPLGHRQSQAGVRQGGAGHKAVVVATEEGATEGGQRPRVGVGGQHGIKAAGGGGGGGGGGGKGGRTT
jgi:hypothetical protein